MVTYSFKDAKEEHLYVQLYDFIRKDIIEGRLTPGEHLPSKRKMADLQGVSTITVEKAYSQLLTEGYLTSQPRKGYFVAELSAAGRVEAEEEADRRTLASDEPLLGPEDDPEWYAGQVLNRTEKDSFPFVTWTKLMREVIRTRQDDLMTPSPAQGVADLRRAIADHLKSFRGLTVSPDQIVVGAGTEYLYTVIVQLLGKDLIYALEDPGYPKSGDVFRMQHAACVYARLDSHGMVPDALREQGANVAVISPSHQFPTGIVMPINRRYELLGWANETDQHYIVEDDYDSEFRMSGKPIPTMTGMDLTGRTIYMNTFSNSMASTFRISYMILPPKLAEIYRRRYRHMNCTVSTFEQYTLAAFISQGYFAKHLSHMRSHYRKKREAFMEILSRPDFRKAVQVFEHGDGLHFLIKIPGLRSDEDFITGCRREDIRISALSDYYQHPTKDAEHVFVVGYTGISIERIQRSAEKMRKLYLCNAASDSGEDPMTSAL